MTNLLSKVIENDHMQTILQEFSRLKDLCYLDNAGTALYPQCLLSKVNEDLTNSIYMNPHTDSYTEDCVDQIRTLILNHYNTNSTEYSVIFTSGATQALKLVGEAFQYASVKNTSKNNGSFIYLEDNHTSVIGMREIAKSKNVDVIYIPHESFKEALSSKNKIFYENLNRNYNTGNSLFVYPPQSSFNGYKYPLEAIDGVKQGCLNTYLKKKLNKTYDNWYILLDAASFASTNKLDLSLSKPDFVCVSFYKIFGFPTGLGALIVKNSSVETLAEKTYFGGGTVEVLLSSEDYHIKRKGIHERFEDGTTSFLSIIMLKHAFDTLNNLIPKVINNDCMDTISRHTFELAKDLYKQLRVLTHDNGRRAIVLYVESDFSDIKEQGGIVTFNLVRDDGTYIGYSEFQEMAQLFRISIRTGCFCNVGSCHRHLELSNNDVKSMHKAGHTCNSQVDLIEGRPTGCIRTSFAYYNTYNDVDKLVHMIHRCYLKKTFIKPKRTLENFERVTISNGTKNEEGKYLNGISQNTVLPIEKLYKKPVNNSSNIYLKEIAIYPIKSCGAFKPSHAWKMSSKGFEFDREWMIVKDNGVCLTQKQNTRMCMIRPYIDLSKSLLILYFPEKDPISLPLTHSEQIQYNASLCQSKVCSDTINAYDCGDKVANWISEALEISYLRLLRQSASDSRVVKTKTVEEHKLLSLSNQAQYLLLNKATVRWLRNHIDDPEFNDDVDNLTDRFRGNIIVDSSQELMERDWKRIVIGKHEFKVDGPCSRCQMVCIDQQSGEKTAEPLRTISHQFGGKIKFGIYLSYVGTVDGSKSCLLNNNSIVTAFIDTDKPSK